MVAIITGGASGMGEARKFAAHGLRVRCSQCTSHRHRRLPRREGPSSSSSLSDLADLSLSLSLYWWLVVLIVVGWLISVDGGRLIGLWVVAEPEI